MFLCSHGSFPSIKTNHQSLNWSSLSAFLIAGFWCLEHVFVRECFSVPEFKWNNIDRDSVNHAHTWNHVNVECHSVISSTSNDLPLWCNGPISFFFIFFFLDPPISPFLSFSISTKIFSHLAPWQVIRHSEEWENKLVRWTEPACVGGWGLVDTMLLIFLITHPPLR